MSRGIRNREIKLEQRNQLLRITNQKLAQAYKSVGLGALSGHLMHSLKTPLTHLQLIAREAEEKKEIDAKELQNVHLNIRELVSESLQALKEFENQNISYQITIAELFDQVIQRTHKTFPSAQISICKNNALNQNIDNLQSTLLLPVLTSLLTMHLSRITCQVSLSSKLDDGIVTLKFPTPVVGFSRINNLFFDPSKSTKRRYRLGLAIAHQLSQSMEANLVLVKSDSKGSVFNISFNA